MKFGEHIKSKMDLLGITQKELAGNLGISPQYLNDIIRGRRNPPGDELLTELARLLWTNPIILYCLAGRLPPKIHNYILENPAAAWEMFRDFESDYSPRLKAGASWG